METEQQNEVADLLRSAKIKLTPITTSIGQLTVRGLSHKSDINLHNLLKAKGKRIESISADDYFEVLCHELLFKAKEEELGNRLSVDEIRNLSKDDKAALIELFLKQHDYLAYESKFEPKKREGGGTEFVLTRKKLTQPKRDDETNIEYLYRLRMIAVEKQNKVIGEATKEMAKHFNFSKGLNEKIAGMLPDFGKSAAHMLQSVRIQEVPVRLPIPDIRPPRNYTLEELRELNVNVEGLNGNVELLNNNVTALHTSFGSLNEKTDKSTELIALMLNEMQDNGKQTKYFTWVNIGISLLALWVATRTPDQSEIIRELQAINSSLNTSKTVKDIPMDDFQRLFVAMDKGTATSPTETKANRK